MLQVTKLETAALISLGCFNDLYVQDELWSATLSKILSVKYCFIFLKNIFSGI